MGTISIPPNTGTDNLLFSGPVYIVQLVLHVARDFSKAASNDREYACRRPSEFLTSGGGWLILNNSELQDYGHLIVLLLQIRPPTNHGRKATVQKRGTEVGLKHPLSSHRLVVESGGQRQTRFVTKRRLVYILTRTR